MKTSAQTICTAIAGIMAIGINAATAAELPAMEKCAGIVKASQNDCATSTTACHGSVNTNANPEAWIYLPQGTCEKIVGGHITLQKAPHEKASFALPKYHHGPLSRG
jgi:uncharacterized membrane protein